MLTYGVRVFTNPNSAVVVVHIATCVNCGGLITEKNVVEVPHICINLFQRKYYTLDPFRLIMQLDFV
jgi:hypothetical protein